jgi:hypothetical protein
MAAVLGLADNMSKKFVLLSTVLLVAATTTVPDN